MKVLTNVRREGFFAMPGLFLSGVESEQRESTKEHVAKITTINTETASFDSARDALSDSRRAECAEIYWLSGLSEFCVQRRVGNFENAL